MRKLDTLVAIIMIIGGVNWGLIGLFDFNLIQYVFSGCYIDRIAYVIVGIAAVYQIVGWKAMKKRTKR
ncbi:MAG: DUF378 domain-containing protein [Simkania sp.]|nr:DUF378 domain-containing protein [Simkania sp.]MCP5490204.1 DUF378 domain-containing protein [Chlamydiales bacterium]